MCGRYFLPLDEANEELAEVIRAVSEKYGGDQPLAAHGEIYPGQMVPTLANSRKGEPGAYAMQWGMSRPFGGTGIVINARSETAECKGMFRESWAERRCLIPAARYFEWERRGKEKVKYAIGPAGKAAFYLAGLYRYEPDERFPRFVILTREAATPISFIHPRMPVIFDGRSARAWLDPKEAPRKILGEAMEDMTFEAV